MTEERQLLQSYLQHDAREALDALIRRHLDLVYSAAVRQVRDRHLAEDVTQAVFLVLARKAGSIRQGVAVGGWLLAVTRNTCLNAIKKRGIQMRHEQAAARSEAQVREPQAWEQLEPALDQALSRLGRRDRDAIVLRFFQQRTFAQVGAELDLTEEAARKRVGRALCRLRELLTARGTAFSEASLAATLVANVVHAPPAGIAIMVSPSAAALTLSNTVLSTMRWVRLKVAAAVVVAAGAVAGAGAALAPPPPTPPATMRAATAPATTGPATPFDVAAARRSIEAALRATESLSVTFQSVLESPQDATIPQPEPAKTTTGRVPEELGYFVGGRLGKIITEVQISRRETLYRRDTQLSQSADPLANDNANGLGLFSTSFDGQSIQTLQEWINGQVSGNTRPAEGYSTPDFPRTMGFATLRLNIQEIQSLPLSLAINKRSILMTRSTAANVREEWEFDPGLGYAITAYRLTYTAPGGGEGGSEELADDFRDVNGVQLPHRIVIRQTTINGAETYRTTITVERYELNSASNNAAHYRMAWPAGAKVMNTQNNTEYVADKDGILLNTPQRALRRYGALAQSSTQPAPASEALKNLTKLGVFAEPVELTINDFRASTTGNAIDLDRTVVLDAPKPRENVTAALRGAGVDVAMLFGASGNEAHLVWGVGGTGTVLTKLPTSAWEHPDLQLLEGAIISGEPGVPVSGSEQQMFILLEEKPELPIVLSFWTQDGGAGMLRITKLTDEPARRMTLQVMRLVLPEIRKAP